MKLTPLPSLNRVPIRRFLALPLSVGLGGLLVALVFAGLRAHPAAAAAPAEPASYNCDEAGLDSALAAGGSATFNCSVPTPITVTVLKNVTKSVTLDGGNNVILTGAGTTNLFSVGAGIHLGLLNLTLRDASQAIDNYGVLNATQTHFISDTEGALFNEPGSTATFANSTVTGAFTKGGALINGSFPTGTASLSVINSMLHDNIGGSGAAILNNAGTVTVTGSIFYANHAVRGGAIFNQSQLSVMSSQFFSNTANAFIVAGPSQPAWQQAGPAGPAAYTSYVGGAIYSTADGDVIISGSTFTGNISVNGGGAVMVGDLPTGVPVTPTAHSLTVTGSTFSHNCSDGPGGALFAGLQATVSNSSFTFNAADSGASACIAPVAALSSQPFSGAPQLQNQPATGPVPNVAGAGGAIFNSTVLTVTNSNFLTNTATITPTEGGGGAIEAYSYARLQVSNGTFQGNTATLDGGAIYNGFLSVASLAGSSFTGNSAQNGSGGAVASVGQLSVTHSSFTGNNGAPGQNLYGAGGGAIFAGSAFAVSGPTRLGTAPTVGAPQGLFTGPLLAVDHSTFTANSSVFKGGAIDAGDSVISTSTFQSNSAAYGGGIHVLFPPFTVDSSTFIGNAAVTTTLYSATQGGALDTGPDNASIVNSTFYANRAEGAATGGAINTTFSVTVNITNSTFLSNTADTNSFGGTLAHGTAAIVLRDVLLAFSGGGDCNSTVTLSGANLEFGDGSCGVATVTANPNILPPANNGGPTLTSALLPNSPARDAGDNAGCPATDQRGVPRPQNGKCDIGAFEFRGLWLPVIRK